MTEDLLEVRDLSVGYHETPVVRRLNLTVGRGEVVALLGPNGAGKTTTLNAISGLLRPFFGGEILFNGESVSHLPPQTLAKKGIVHVPEERGIFHSLSVKEHFRLGTRREPFDPDIAFGYFPQLRDLLDRRAGLLSGGEQQMLAIGCGLARSPRLLLIDELSLGLAPVIVERLLPVVRKVAEERDCGVILVEQHVELALSIADRGYVLSHGDIVLDQDAEALRADPSIVVAGYLGDHEARHRAQPPVKP